MNPIEFRAWNQKEKTFIQWNDIWKEVNGGLMGDDDDLQYELFTGIVDAKGKKIFEGDILLVWEWNADGNSKMRYRPASLHEVGWSEDMTSFRLYPLHEADDIDGLNNIDGDKYRVVGNVHQNPELYEDFDYPA